MSISYSSILPGSFSYTPSWISGSPIGASNPTLGNGTMNGSYMRIGQFVSYTVDVTFASGTSAGAGAWSFSLPVAAKDNIRYSGGAFLFDSGTAFDAASCVTTSATLVQITAGLGNGNYVNTAWPFTWVNGDRCAFTLVYEAASG